MTTPAPIVITVQNDTFDVEITVVPIAAAGASAASTAIR